VGKKKKTCPASLLFLSFEDFKRGIKGTGRGGGGGKEEGETVHPGKK